MTRPVALLGGKRGRMLLILALIPAAALAAYVGGRGGEDALARGRQLYLENCASCHGARLEGQPDWQRRLASVRMPAPPHDASGHTWHHPDRVLFEITKQGPEAVVGGGPASSTSLSTSTRPGAPRTPSEPSACRSPC